MSRRTVVPSRPGIRARIGRLFGRIARPTVAWSGVMLAGLATFVIGIGFWFGLGPALTLGGLATFGLGAIGLATPAPRNRP